jgi:hypothetical protein
MPIRQPSFIRPVVTAFWLIGIIAGLREPLAFNDGKPDMPSATWVEVREQTACEAMQDDYCLGRYGFTIKRDGTFIAGPSGQGGKAEGRIKPQELRRLGELIAQLSANHSPGERTCDPGGPPGIRDQVDITFPSGRVARAYDLGGSVGKICYIGVWEDVRKLHAYLHRLLNRYYPVPFPKH